MNVPGFFFSSLRELLYYRELIYFFVWRDIALRYKQTVIGVAWVILQPFIMMVVFSFLFGTVAKIATGNIPYPLFVYLGLLFWNLFSRSVTASSESIVANRNLIGKIYFPRLIFLISAIMVNLVDFIVAFTVFILLMLYYQFAPNFLGFFFLPFALCITLMFAAGIGAMLATLNVYYRDIRFIIPFALQVLLFLTPVVYPANFISEKYRLILQLNPMAAIIESVQGTLLGTSTVNVGFLGISVFVSILSFFIGLGYFMRSEKYFADIV